MPSSRMIRSTTVALLLLLLFPVTSLVAAQIDNRVEGEGIFADQTIRFMYPNEPMPGASLRLRVRAFKNDLSAAEIRIWNGSEKTYAMHKIAEDEIFEYWEGTVPGTEVRDDLWYHFVLHDGTDTKWYNVDGVRNSQPYERDFPVHPGFRTPQWAKEATFYQIFVDRFYDGDPSNNVPDEAYALGQYKVYTHDDWNELPENPGHGNDFFGGDLAGVEAKLPYLQDLGVTAIYLNPIFLSPSNSKYDTRDYRIVDSPEEWGFGFGGDAAFDSLLHAAHNAGIRVILDGVFNHTGDWHQWFDRAGQYPTDGAFESKASEWSTFYTFFEWPYSFCHWSTFGMMPKLNYAEERVREEIYRNEDAIARYWPGERDTDGWRLDVPNEAGPYCEGGDHSIWREFRNAVKSVRPDAYITGEIWENATPWLEGDQFDAVMNYNGFAKPVWRFIAGRDKDNNPATLDVDAFDAWLSGVRGDNPPQATYAQQNLLDSHDTYRFLTLAGGDWRKVREAAILQMTYVGPPMI
ncbi:MAG: glycoside hydrolase family 13 protein, partial [Deltaproteobacteria bacterium]